MSKRDERIKDATESIATMYGQMQQDFADMFFGVTTGRLSSDKPNTSNVPRSLQQEKEVTEYE